MMAATFAFYFELAVNLGLCGVAIFVISVIHRNLRGVPADRMMLVSSVRGAYRFTRGLWWFGRLLGLVWCLGWFGV